MPASMDGEAIYSALLSHASHLTIPTPTAAANYLAVKLASSLPTPPPGGLGSDAGSEAIYSALLAYAQRGGGQVSSITEALTFSNHAVKEVASVTSPAVEGFMTASLEGLPSVVSILLGVVILLLGLFFAVCGARSLVWLNHWGKERGVKEGRSYFPGGVGGLLFGGVAIGTIASILTLLIVSHQTKPSLGSWGVLAILISTAPIGSFVGGRFRFAARLFTGLLAGTSLAVLLAITVKLSTLLPRLVLLAILVPAGAVLSLLTPTIRSLTIMSAGVGTWLIITGIDVFVHLGFVDGLGLLVSHYGVASTGVATQVSLDWDNSAFKGLLAAWWIVFAISSVWQFWWGGEGAGDVDETWNSYLASFIASHPNARGSFYPQRSFFARLFEPKRPSSPLTDIPGAFPRNRRRSWEDEEKGSDWDSDVDTLQCSAPVKYGNIRTIVEEIDEVEEEVDEDEKKMLWKETVVTAVRFDEEKSNGEKEFFLQERKTSFDALSRTSGDTAVDAGNLQEIKSMEKALEIEEVSDDEDEVSAKELGDKKSGTTRGLFSTKGRNEPARYTGVRPLAQILPADNFTSEPTSMPDVPTSTPSTSSPAVYQSYTTPTSAPPAVPFPASVPVPATPSLLNALKRINVAQRQARGEEPVTSATPPTVEIPLRHTTRRRNQSWDDWWGDVQKKAEKK